MKMWFHSVNTVTKVLLQRAAFKYVIDVNYYSTMEPSHIIDYYYFTFT